MKKTTRKLVLRKETVRELSRQALSRVLGGQDTDAAAAEPQSRDKQCTTLIAALDGVARDRPD